MTARIQTLLLAKTRDFEAASPCQLFVQVYPDVLAGSVGGVGEPGRYHFSNAKLVSITFSPELETDIRSCRQRFDVLVKR
jgi:hypothetical protein